MKEIDKKENNVCTNCGNEKSDEISKYINETLMGSDDNINNK